MLFYRYNYCGSILASHFECESEDKIIPYKNMCDGNPTCNDGSDEKNCSKTIVLISIQLCRIGK